MVEHINTQEARERDTCLEQLKGVVQVDADGVGVEIGQDVH
jgi:hypothetical protein